MDDTSKPKTNKVDIWSLGCLLYQMVAGSPLFKGPNAVWAYAVKASSPPQAVRNKGLSIACEDFLRDLLQPSPDDRPSAEDCFTKPWIMSKAAGSEYSIGSDLYKKLARVQHGAPDVDTFSNIVAHQPVDNPLAGGSPAGMMPMAYPMAYPMANSLKS